MRNTIIIVNCFDPLNPKAGGAEIYNRQLISDLHANDEVIWLAERFPGSKKSDTYKNINIVRFGNRITLVPFATLFYIKLRTKRQISKVYDCFHGYPNFLNLVVSKDILQPVIYEVAGYSIWKKIVFPFSIIGTLLEKLSLSYLYKDYEFITISKSTQLELKALGVNSNVINPKVRSEVIKHKPSNIEKNRNQLVNFGGIRPVKNIEDIIIALATIKRVIPDIKLYITGSRNQNEKHYHTKLDNLITKNDLQNNVIFTGFISNHDLATLVSESELHIATSIKEGWGMTIAEASELGTKTVCYNSKGYRDVSKLYKNVIISDSNPKRLAELIITELLK